MEWVISQKRIEVYRAAAQNLCISYQSILLADEESGGREALNGIISQYGSL